MHERMAGMRGNFILVNGTIRPLYRAQRRQTRFRILNGSNARIYNLHFSDNREFTQIASDGGFMPTPVRMKHLRLAPGERAEIIVEFGAKDDVMLQHKPLPTSNFGMGMGMMAMMMSGDDQPFNIMRFVSKNPGGEISTWQGVKHEQHDLNPANIVNTRTFGLDMAMGMGMMMNRMSGAGSGMTINNKSFDMNRIDEVVRLNDTEVWEFTNNSPLPHPMHIHDIQFRVLSRNNGPAELNENGLKDTVLVNPDETVRVITRFEHYTDERFPYMFHCHILEHEDQGMMGQFVVV
jgi:FtsP/CotA-like multicopper oxidase with cupredoxin domain